MNRFVIVLTAVLLAQVLYAAEWMQWRGPNHDGISTEMGLLPAWPEAGPKLLWKTDNLGKGYSNLIFHNGKMFSMGDFDGDCFLYALDSKDRSKPWSLKVGKAGGSEGNTFIGPRCTPATDGKLIFAIGQFGDFVCADVETGREFWRVNVVEQYGAFVLRSVKSGLHWNFAMSPIIDGDRVVLPIGGANGTVICFEKSKKGPNVLWQSKEITDGAAYTSIVPFTFGGREQYLLLTMNVIAGLDPNSGTVLWQTAYPGITAICSDPVFWKEDEKTCYIMAASGYDVGARGFKLTADNGVFNIEEIFSVQSLQSHHGGIVQVGGYFYLLTQRELVCVEPKTGTIRWKNRSVGKGSISVADGKLIVRSESGDGTVALVEVNSEEYRKISQFDQPDRSDKNSWTYPLVYEGKLYLRDQGLLLCYQLTINH